MKNIIKKSILLVLTLAVLIITINITVSLKNTNNSQFKSDVIDKNNAKTLQIDEEIITNLSQRSGNSTSAMTKIKNISNLNISQIVLYYEELDKNDKLVSSSKIDIDITISPKEVMQIEFAPKDYTNTIRITGYTYIGEDCKVIIDLKDNQIEIFENEKYLENSKNYEVISIGQVNKNKSMCVIEIENISHENLGNIVLKVAEIDKNKEIVKIDHIIFNDILKPSQKEEIVTSLSDDNYDVKILGYTYDDMENKSNVDIDLITHKVNIIDNK